MIVRIEEKCSGGTRCVYNSTTDFEMKDQCSRFYHGLLLLFFKSEAFLLEDDSMRQTYTSSSVRSLDSTRSRFKFFEFCLLRQLILPLFFKK